MNEKLTESLKITHYDFDPDATSAVDIAWVDFRDFGRFLVSVFRTVGASDITFKILANAQSNGGGTDVEVVSLTMAQLGDPDAVGDYAFYEISANDILAAAKAAGVEGVRYVSANLAVATGTDELVVTYVLGEPRFKAAGLTANSIA